MRHTLRNVYCIMVGCIYSFLLSVFVWETITFAISQAPSEVRVILIIYFNMHGHKVII